MPIAAKSAREIDAVPFRAHLVSPGP